MLDSLRAVILHVDAPMLSLNSLSPSTSHKVLTFSPSDERTLAKMHQWPTCRLKMRRNPLPLQYVHFRPTNFDFCLLTGSIRCY